MDARKRRDLATARGGATTRVRSRAIPVALLLASAALSLAAAECAVRVVRPQPLGFSRLSPEGLELHLPGHAAVYRRDEFAARVRINALGFRGGEFAIPKPPGTFRILALGDSFVEGMQVDEEALVTTQIERAMAGRAPRVEVLNLGVSGHGTDDALDVLRVYGPRLEPDLVLLFFCLANDLQNNLLEEKCRLTQTGLACRPPAVPSPSRLAFARAKSWLGAHSELYQAAKAATSDPFWQRVGLRSATAPESVASMPFGRELFREPRPAYLESALALTRELLRALREQADALGAPTFLVLVPLREQVEDTQWPVYAAGDPTLSRDAAQRALAAIARDAGVTVVDPLAAFRARDADGDRLYWRVDAHWNAIGHEVAAAQVVAALHKHGLPPESRP